LLLGYDHSLVEITSQGIPSIHICLDFIPELLAQQNIEKQIFAVKLAGFIAVKYPIAKSLEVCKIILYRMRHKSSGLGESLSYLEVTEFFCVTVNYFAE
jgi:hypothetical protein